MDNSFHYLMMINNTLFHKEIMCELIKAGLTPGQPKVLDYLAAHDGSMQKEIAAGTLTDEATLTGIITKMEKKGFIERRMKEGNRRTYYVYLTELGREKAETVKCIFKEKENKVLACLTESEKEEFIGLFKKIHNNMSGRGEN
ncbi:MarR family transcriptional regulator [Clostridium botulinum]|uniref:MarR family winged helix-turn-helix transcriptional regulator n=2 Tax=Clostridium botulinum TaxID=1491 RepID=UPI000174E555|nr:MarR family winged helix-turn-helix transcriptional regulator [Clostridium botulinum]ACD53347.1 transcriptional regulator, MarR/EmrR family [Clostridium botulinum E3 str. Alaska E43]AJF30277.1 MarR family transcriptional regulator [Clostridium botulinum]AJF33340.1 MarR family transcriptional regulator [Clostridium botulinum]MBN1071816.1 MarR family transcriptional regulator [Clostridium botulinum]MBY6788517.1 winged helix-turn-helix transcriptional regulator [Clostridium botulinum]